MASPKRKYSQQDIFDRSAEYAEEADGLDMPPADNYQNDRQSKQAVRIGDVLKRERERRGYDLQQIADYLCIRRGLLAAIEGSRYEEFPADAYVIGFLRSYADLIGLNGQEAINHYRHEMAGRRRKPDLVVPTPISEGRAPTAVIMGAAALASLLIYILWYAFSTSDRTTVTTPPTLPTNIETSSPATATTTATTALPATAPAMAPTTNAVETLPATATSGIAISAPAPSAKTLQPASANNTAAESAAAATTAPVATATSSSEIVIKADQSSWVLVSNSKGQTIYDHVMKPGETYEVPKQSGLTLTTGNGAGVVLVLDGVDMPRLSTTTSHIVRNVPLEASALKALPQTPAQ